ncbi:MAG: 6-carboxytetrahydropterin synthase [Cytophagaceae bacterium]
MNKIRIVKLFTIEMAHQLFNHDGLCKNIHGHSYYLEVTILGSPKEEAYHPKDGMVMDFSELKNIIHKNIIEPFDHALVLNQLVLDENIEKLRLFTEKICIVPFQPTCENLTLLFAKRISKELPATLTLAKLKLGETATSFCEWCIEDNN